MKGERIRRQQSKTRQPCELALKGPNLQGWASGRERSSRLAQPWGVEGEEETNAKLQSPPDQEVNPTQPRFPPPRGDTDPASQAFGFSKLEILPYLWSLQCVSRPSQVFRSSLGQSRPTGSHPCLAVFTERPAGQSGAGDRWA